MGRVEAVALGLLVIAAPEGAALQEPPLLPTLLARATAYVDRFEHNFALVVSDEDYVQEASGRGQRTKRHTRAEMLFMWLPDEAVWLTVRNVRDVDGRPIVDSDKRLERAFAETTDRVKRLRQLRDESSRFNIGEIGRNVNYPTLPLQFFEIANRPRFRFGADRRDVVNGLPATEVRFDEVVTPTIVQSGSGYNQFSRGTAWIADEGTIVRTTVEIYQPFRPSGVTITVDYQLDPKLSMWVPVQMREHYAQGAERIDCVATYANFRRFETSARIIQ